MTLPVFDILAEGRFGSDAVAVLYEPVARPTTGELERLIESEWQTRTVEARNAGRRLFNGDLLRYVGHEVRDGRFCMTVGPTCYRDFLGSNLYQGSRVTEFGWERFANPVGTTATLMTRDGVLALGRRSDRVAWHGGFVHTFGGALERVDLNADGTVDAFAAVRRELAEEAALGAADIEEMVCVGLIRDREIHQPELLFEARLKLTFGEWLGRLAVSDAGDEHVGIAAMLDQAEAIEAFVRSCGPIAPVAVGALALHGRRMESGREASR